MGVIDSIKARSYDHRPWPESCIFIYLLRYVSSNDML